MSTDALVTSHSLLRGFCLLNGERKSELRISNSRNLLVPQKTRKNCEERPLMFKQKGRSWARNSSLWDQIMSVRQNKVKTSSQCKLCLKSSMQMWFTSLNLIVTRILTSVSSIPWLVGPASEPGAINLVLLSLPVTRLQSPTVSLINYFSVSFPGNNKTF